MKVDLLSDFKRDVSRLYEMLYDDRFYSEARVASCWIADEVSISW